jgi:hypothetical protein
VRLSRTAAKPAGASYSWTNACWCGMRFCRSGWPQDAPPPRDLPDPLSYLQERLAEELGSMEQRRLFDERARREREQIDVCDPGPA